jgi:hypothetical protein
MSEPMNWIDRVDHVMGWGKRHPFLAKVLTGLFMLVVAFIALSWQIKTTGHE